MRVAISSVRGPTSLEGPSIPAPKSKTFRACRDADRLGKRPWPRGKSRPATSRRTQESERPLMTGAIGVAMGR